MSTFLHDDVVVGDELEVRGPIGGWFVWNGDTPALLVGGGSGVVPLMAMLRLARRTGRSDLVQLVVSVRSPDDLFYADELAGPETDARLHACDTAGVLAAAGPPHARATSRNRLAPAVAHGLRVRVVGLRRRREPTCSSASGVPTDQIRVERFGPSG